MDDLFNTNPAISALLAALIGIALMDDLTANEQAVVGNWFMLLGQTLVTTGASQAFIEKRISGGIININDKRVKKEYNPIIYDINEIKTIINKNFSHHICDDSIIALKKAVGIMQQQIDDIHKQ